MRLFLNGAGTWESSAEPLTQEKLLLFMEKAKKTAFEPEPVCGIDTPHFVHPNARGWTNCACCFQIVWAGAEPPTEEQEMALGKALAEAYDLV